MQRIHREVGDARFDGGRFPEARDLFVRLSTTPKFEDFLTLPAYDLLASPTDAIASVTASGLK